MLLDRADQPRWPHTSACVVRRIRSDTAGSGLRAYLAESFAEESRPAQVWFGEPQVDGDAAAVEYWAVVHIKDQPMTISGCTMLRFDEVGLVAEARDYSHVQEGQHSPPAGLFE
ncbi:hypothetical protein ACFYL6_05360 [Micromonospora sp. NPDC007208]|uniref:hypothetical protein n=1 Tax=Micromonospora sp. NPDC007208 TaxID=3364236 RepID=UPI0036B928E1